MCQAQGGGSAGTAALMHVPGGASGLGARDALLTPVPFHLPPCVLPAAGAVLARGKPVSAHSPAFAGCGGVGVRQELSADPIQSCGAC